MLKILTLCGLVAWLLTDAVPAAGETAGVPERKGDGSESGEIPDAEGAERAPCGQSRIPEVIAEWTERCPEQPVAIDKTLLWTVQKHVDGLPLRRIRRPLSATERAWAKQMRIIGCMARGTATAAHALYLEAALYHRAGHLDRARALYCKLLRDSPDQPFDAETIRYFIWRLNFPVPASDRDGQKPGKWDLRQIPAELDQRFWVHHDSRMEWNLGGGYFHPLLDISERYHPGWLIDFRLIFWWKKLGVSIAGSLYGSAGSDEEIAVPAGYDGNDEPDRLSLEPGAAFFGLGFHWQLIASRRWLLSIGATPGIAAYFVNNEGGQERYQDFRRTRVAAMLFEDLELDYLFTSTPIGGLGLYLSVGLGQAYSWNSDGVQPDLQARDSADYGLELWPRAVLGLKLGVSGKAGGVAPFEGPDKEVRQAIGRFDLQYGYSHPLGRIGEVYKPGWCGSMQLAGRGRGIEAGLYAAGAISTRSGEEVYLSADDSDNPFDYPIKLTSEPVAGFAGAFFSPLVFSTGDWLLSLGLRLGFAYREIDRDATGDDRDRFEAYRRKRAGISLGQYAEGTWFFLRDALGMVGIIARVGIDEAYTWNIDGVQPDLGEEDTTAYGLELWPMLTAGLIVMM